jgi:Ca-activated chloride channel homolog
MASKIERAREAVLALLEESNPQHELFLIAFADTPHLVQNFTQAIAEMQEQLLFARPKGRTALLDAIYLGLDKMREAKYSRRALVVISDGSDNRSQYTEKGSEVQDRGIRRPYLLRWYLIENSPPGKNG